MTILGASGDAVAAMSTANWLTLGGGFLTVIGGVVIARMTGRQNKSTAEVQQRGPDWKAFTDVLQTQQNATNTRLDAAEKKAREAADQADEDRRRLDRTRASLRDLRGRYVASLRHIKEWRVWVVTRDGEPPTLPSELVVDVDDPPGRIDD